MKTADRSATRGPKLWPSFVAVLSCCLAISSNLTKAENWPQFRGADGSGISSEKGIPTSWSQGEYLWDVAITGTGHGAPVIWGDSVFVTS
ncbi:MAG: pyrrolo-quinoline quinone beta-propeller repeat-containing protein, partial [Planctomycetota bacterium]